LILIIIIGNISFLSSCSYKQPKQTISNIKFDGQKIVEAYEKRDWETVVSICDTVIDERDTMNLIILYAEALAAVGNPQKAIYLLNKKLDRTPDDYYLYQTKGNVYYSAAMFDSAIICYEKVISMRPSYARPYINVGDVYELIGNKDKAIENYWTAAKLFAINGYSEEAKEYAEKVLTLDSTNADAYDLLESLQ
ncbi:MAG: hypothetical protein K2M96_04345, partial [Prevotella sp.]|nr:hypothetical protein [Prevotella sp.]